MKFPEEKLEKAFTGLLGQEEMSSFWCRKLDNLDIPVILTPHSGHIDPPGFWYQRARIADKFTVFFLGYLL